MENYKIRKHNKPISIAIKGYLDKSGGKVTASRNEIEWRFNALDWKYQKQILFAFLQSGMSDRKWAYKKLYTFWDDCFIPFLKDIWELYHERELSWLIIQFFPSDCLKKKMKELSEGRNYYFLYRRLRDDPDFVLDKTRLDEADLLEARYISGEKIFDEDAKDHFFLLIYKLCKGRYGYYANTVTAYNEEPDFLSIFGCSKVSAMMRTIDMSLKKYGLYSELRKWMFSISKDFLRDYGLSYNGGHSNEERRNVLGEYTMKYLAQEYKEIWETYDLDDQQQYIDYLDERHKQRVQELKSVESLNEAKEDINSEITDIGDLYLFNNLDWEINEDVPF